MNLFDLNIEIDIDHIFSWAWLDIPKYTQFFLKL